MPEELIRESGFKTFGWVKVSFLDKDEDSNSNSAVAMRVWPIPDTISSSSMTGNVMMNKDGFLANYVNQLV